MIGAAAILYSAVAMSEGVYVGPVPPPVTPPSNTAPVAGPAELCVNDDCSPVIYSWIGGIVVAETYFNGGYQVIGWAGPCIDNDCPNIQALAFDDLKVNVFRANRAKRADTLAPTRQVPGYLWSD